MPGRINLEPNRGNQPHRRASHHASGFALRTWYVAKGRATHKYIYTCTYLYICDRYTCWQSVGCCVTCWPDANHLCAGVSARQSTSVANVGCMLSFCSFASANGCCCTLCPFHCCCMLFLCRAHVSPLDGLPCATGWLH